MSEATSRQPGQDAVEEQALQSVPEEQPRQIAGGRIRRLVLLLGVPVVVVVAALLFYLNGGRFVSTENAYVKSHIVNVAGEVPGTISEVLVEENQRVDKGALLFRLDERPYELQLRRAEARLSEVATSIAADKQAYKRALTEISLYKSAVDFARRQLDRQEGLVNANLGRQEDLDTAAYELDSARRRVTIAREEAASLLARLNGDPEVPLNEYPAWLAAEAERDQARLDLERTSVHAPFAGIVTNRPEPGDYVERGAPVTSIVSDQGMWVVANFKETQMTHINPGQPVRFEVDAYPGNTFTGEVESISRSTGAEFALLPPQNATGNWVKIVQRVPVRIRMQRADDSVALRAGMSCAVTVDTGHDRDWHELLPGA